jgi:hypothetical protein
MRRAVVSLVLLASVACSSKASNSVASSPAGTPSIPSPTPSLSASPSPLALLVGHWELKRTCTAIVKALKEAHFTDLIPQDVTELIKGVPENGSLPETWDPSHPCANAKPPTEHSHTFWPDGMFNSYDENNQQVDDGPYTIIDDHTFAIGSTTFSYRITNGDTLMMEPVIPAPCSKNCREDLGWAFSVSYPGQSWKRLTSGPNTP